MSRTDYSPHELATCIFCDYIHSVLGKPVIIYKSNTPQLSEPYFSVYIEEDAQLPHDLVTFNKITGLEEVRGLGLLSFVIQGYGDRPMSDLVKLQQSYETSMFTFGLEAYGFGLSEKGRVADTTAPLIDSRFEARAELKNVFYHCTSNKFQATWFDKMKVSVMARDYIYEFNGEEPPTKQGEICENY